MTAIANAVGRLASREDWQAWLALSARLGRRKRYSARNTMWLFAQAAERGVKLSLLDGYRWWNRRSHRQVVEMGSVES